MTDDELWSRAVGLWQGSNDKIKLLLEDVFPHMRHYSYAVDRRFHHVTQMMLDHPDCTEIISILLMMFDENSFCTHPNADLWTIINRQLQWAKFKNHSVLQLDSMRCELESLQDMLAKRDEENETRGQLGIAISVNKMEEASISEGTEFRASQTSVDDLSSLSSPGTITNSEDSHECIRVERDIAHKPTIPMNDEKPLSVTGSHGVDTTGCPLASDAQAGLPETRNGTKSMTEETSFDFDVRKYIKGRLREENVPVETGRIRSKEGWEEHDVTVMKALFEACDIQSQLINILLQERDDYKRQKEKTIQSLDDAVAIYKTASSHKRTSHVEEIDHFTQQQQKAFDKQREILQTSMEKMVHYSITNWEVQAAEAIRQSRRRALDEMEKTDKAIKSKDDQVETAVEQFKEQVDNTSQWALNLGLNGTCGIDIKPWHHCYDLHVESDMDSKKWDFGENEIPCSMPLKRRRVDSATEYWDG